MADKSTSVPYKTLEEEGGPQGPPPSYAQVSTPAPTQGAAYPPGPAYGQAPQAGPPQAGYPPYAPQAPYPQGGYNLQSYPAPVVAQPQVVNSASANVVINSAPIRPNSYMVMSCLVYWCCNWLFGGIAFVLSMASQNSADENDMQSARSYGRAAFWVNLAGIGITLVAFVVIMILYFVVWKDEYVNNDYYHDTYYG